MGQELQSLWGYSNKQDVHSLVRETRKQAGFSNTERGNKMRCVEATTGTERQALPPTVEIRREFPSDTGTDPLNKKEFGNLGGWGRG